MNSVKHKFLPCEYRKLFKRNTHQKGEPLRAASLFQLNNNSIFNKNSFILHHPTCSYNHPYNAHQKSHLLLQLLAFLFSLPACSQKHCYNSYQHSISLYLNHFGIPTCTYSHRYSPHQKFFPYPINEQGSLEAPCFLRVTDLLPLKLRKLVYCR